MRDLKPAIHRKVRGNRRKRQQRAPLPWKLILRRVATGVVTLASVVLIGAGAVLGARLVLASDMFHIVQVQVEGGQRLQAEEVVALSDIRLGSSIFDLDLHRIGARLAQNPWIRTARVARVFPRQVVIRVEEREPAAIINLGYLYYVDTTGDVFKVLDSGDRLDFPVITGVDRQDYLSPDSPRRQQVREAVALLGQLAPRHRFGLDDVAEVHLHEEGGLSLVTCQGAVPVHLGRGDYGAKLDRLEAVYKELEPRLTALRGIDLDVPDRVIVKLPEAQPRNG